LFQCRLILAARRKPSGYGCRNFLSLPDGSRRTAPDEIQTLSVFDSGSCSKGLQMSRPRSTAGDELPVIADTLDLLTWTSGRVEKFPRLHRLSLGLRLQTGMHDLLDLLIEARYSSDRLRLLNLCSVRVEQIRLAFRVACDLRILALNSHEFACRRLAEIGRQVGGWKRQQEQKAP
jgi:hypothetical protein